MNERIQPTNKDLEIIDDIIAQYIRPADRKDFKYAFSQVIDILEMAANGEIEEIPADKAKMLLKDPGLDSVIGSTLMGAGILEKEERGIDVLKRILSEQTTQAGEPRYVVIAGEFDDKLEAKAAAQRLSRKVKGEIEVRFYRTPRYVGFWGYKNGKLIREVEEDEVGEEE